MSNRGKEQNEAMTHDELCQVMQAYLARIAPGGPALRNQGADGMAKAARKFLRKIDLGRIPAGKQADFERWLDKQTEALRKSFPRGGQNWGAARKVMNLFLRHASYNAFVRDRHRLQRIEGWLEVPLDGIVAKELARAAGRGVLPRWPGLKGLDKDVSREYQEFAAKFAGRKAIARVHLDPLLWGGDRRS